MSIENEPNESKVEQQGLPEQQVSEETAIKQPAKKKQSGKFKRGFKWAFGPFINVPAWLGGRTIIDGTKDISRVASDYFIPEKATTEETFEQAVERFNLSERDLQERADGLLRVALIFAVIGFAILGYAVYLVFNQQLGAFLLTIVVSMLAFASAFRYHFWCFQVKSRKLGCSFKDWWNSKSTGESQ